MKKHVKKMSKFVFFSIVFITIFFIDGFYFKTLVPSSWSTLLRDAEFKFYDFQVRKLSSDLITRQNLLAKKVFDKEFVVGSEAFKEEYDNLSIDLKTSKEIAIVAIDEKTLDSFGAWPFKRSYYADFLKNLFDKGKARGVVFDIVFAEKGDDAAIRALNEIKSAVKRDLGDEIDVTIERLNYNKKMEAAFAKYRVKIVAGYSTLEDIETTGKDFSNTYFAPEAISLQYAKLTNMEGLSAKEKQDRIAEFEKLKSTRDKLQSYKGGLFNYDVLRASSLYRGYFSVATDPDGNVRWHDPLRVYPIKTLDPKTGEKTEENLEVFPSLSLSTYTLLRGRFDHPRLDGEHIKLKGSASLIPNEQLRAVLKDKLLTAIKSVKSISEYQRKLLLKIANKSDFMAYERLSGLSRLLALYASGDMDKMEGEYAGFLFDVRAIRNERLRLAILSDVDPKILQRFYDPNNKEPEASFKSDFQSSFKKLDKTLVDLLKAECMDKIVQELVPLFSFEGQEKHRVLKEIADHLTIDVAFIKQNFLEKNLEKTSQELTLNENGKLFIQYKGGRNSYLLYSMVDIVKGEDLHATLLNYQTPKITMLEAFEDKVVLIGPTALGINDWRSTPVSSQLDGVELHAEIIDNMLDNSYLLRTSVMRLAEVLFMLIIAVILSFIIRRVNGSFGALITIGFVTAYLSFASYMFDVQNVYFKFLPITLLAVSLYLFLATYQYIQEEKDKKKTRMAFSNYVNKSVVDAVLQDPEMLKLGGQKRVMTVLFSDVRSFTTISEKLDPETLVAFMNEYLEEMTELVLQYDGTLDKFIGDAVMAFWGAPINQENHAELSVRCAIDMNNKLDIMRQELMDKYDVDCRIGVGCNTGPMVVGNMGSKNRFNYTILGDAVNLGARLEGQTKNYGAELILGSTTYELTKHFCATRFLDLIAVKGKSEPVSIYECYGYKDDQTPEFLAGMKAYEDAIETYYLGRRFEEGIQVFEDLKSHRGGTDIACDLYIDRCKDFIENPPDENWNGVFVATSK
ncbi:MAG: CHASE2 domain-containing protein [Candidatus Cloacimonetes bacterium]|nr:CHASE2 domain-containing protein [Candidatus Cloacimonadota bacterium]